MTFPKTAPAARSLCQSVLLATLCLAAPSFGASDPAESRIVDRHGVLSAEVAEKHKTAISKFLAADAKSLPAPGGILFVGSSTIRLWKPFMPEQFPDLPWINRGFGGGRTWECLYFFDEIVSPYKPRLIVFFCGSNDTQAAVRTPEETVEDTRAFLDLVHAKLPGTHVIYLSVTKCPSRRNSWDKMDAINRGVSEAIKENPDASYFEMNDLVFDEKGGPRLDLYRKDLLHFNAAGYATLAKALRPLIDKKFQKADEPKNRR